MVETIGRRLIRTRDNRIKIEEFKVPNPGPGQVLVRVNRSQVSGGSETRWETQPGNINPDTLNLSERDRPMGYNTVGTVIHAGKGMEQYKSGDRVITFGNHGTHWLTGQESYAIDGINPSIQRIEHDISDEQAAFARLGDVAMHAVRRAELQLDESVAIFGQGVVGQLVTSFSRLSGAYPVIAVDLDAERLKLSEQSGATHTINAAQTDPVSEILKLTGAKNADKRLAELKSKGINALEPNKRWMIEGGGAQCVFHATKTAKTLIECMKAASDRGKVVLIGSPFDTVETSIREEMLNKELQIKGSSAATRIEHHAHPYWPWTLQRDRKAIMRMIATGDLKVDHLISHIAKPEAAVDLYKKMALGPSGWMSVFFDWEDDV